RPLEVADGGRVIPSEARGFADQILHDARTHAPDGDEVSGIPHEVERPGAQERVAVPAQHVADLFDLLGRHPVSESFGEGAAASEGTAVSKVQLTHAGGPSLGTELPPEEIAEERIIGVVLALALEGGNEQTPI